MKKENYKSPCLLCYKKVSNENCGSCEKIQQLQIQRREKGRIS